VLLRQHAEILDYSQQLIGDTIKAEMVGVSSKLKSVSIRIRGIDTPELHRFKCVKEKQDAQRAKEYVQSELEIAKSVELKNLAWDKFGGRILADVYVDGSNLSTKILIQGLAVKYYGKKKIQDWCQ
jgi:endonuclease YncB( thermonuclease family)